jgi:hypothetical protein
MESGEKRLESRVVNCRHISLDNVSKTRVGLKTSANHAGLSVVGVGSAADDRGQADEEGVNAEVLLEGTIGKDSEVEQQNRKTFWVLLILMKVVST